MLLGPILAPRLVKPLTTTKSSVYTGRNHSCRPMVWHRHCYWRTAHYRQQLIVHNEIIENHPEVTAQAHGLAAVLRVALLRPLLVRQSCTQVIGKTQAQVAAAGSGQELALLQERALPPRRKGAQPVIGKPKLRWRQTVTGQAPGLPLETLQPPQQVKPSCTTTSSVRPRHR